MWHQDVNFFSGGLFSLGIDEGCEFLCTGNVLMRGWLLAAIRHMCVSLCMYLYIVRGIE